MDGRLLYSVTKWALTPRVWIGVTFYYSSNKLGSMRIKCFISELAWGHQWTGLFQGVSPFQWEASLHPPPSAPAPPQRSQGDQHWRHQTLLQQQLCPHHLQQEIQLQNWPQPEQASLPSLTSLRQGHCRTRCHQCLILHTCVTTTCTTEHAIRPSSLFFWPMSNPTWGHKYLLEPSPSHRLNQDSHPCLWTWTAATRSPLSAAQNNTQDIN